MSTRDNPRERTGLVEVHNSEAFWPEGVGRNGRTVVFKDHVHGLGRPPRRKEAVAGELVTTTSEADERAKMCLVVGDEGEVPQRAMRCKEIVERKERIDLRIPEQGVKKGEKIRK